MDATSVGDFLDALRTRLIARANLAGVAVYTGPVDHLSLGEEAVCFSVDVTSGDCEYRTLPQLEMFESYTVEGRIWIVKAGGGETVIKAARDRAIALLTEVAEELADCNASTPTTQALLFVDDARIVKWSLTQLVIDAGRDCRLGFDIAVKARFNPS